MMSARKTASTRTEVQLKITIWLPSSNGKQKSKVMTKEEKEKERIAARNRVIEENLGLVHKVIRERFMWALNKSVDYDDLVQYGVEGLLKAAEKFNPARQCKFSTLAYWWIRQAISRSVMNEADIVRTPVHAHQDRGKIRKAEEVLRKKLGRSPTLDEIAKKTKMSKANVRLACSYLGSTIVWIDKEVRLDEGKEASRLGEFIPDPTQISPELLVTARQEFKRARHRITFLTRDAEKLGVSERDRKIFETVFGLDGSGEHQSLGIVGRSLGLTRERVRQIIEKILKKNAECNGPAMNTKLMKKKIVRAEELMQLTSST